jgi:two-component system OmpR family response regulator
MSGPAVRVLVVDDEENISYLVSSALRLEGMTTTTVATGRGAITHLETHEADLVVLDVTLPDLDGFEVLKRLRDRGHRQPVIFLTARDSVEDRVRGLTVGGDDYLVKPFAIEELVARVFVVLRRAGHHGRDAVHRYADLELDDDAHLVRRGGRAISLSPTEYKLLRYLLVNAGRVLSRSQILDHVWEYDFGGDSAVVETYVSYLRRKLDTPDAPALIETVRGVGYALRVSEAAP